MLASQGKVPKMTVFMKSLEETNEAVSVSDIRDLSDFCLRWPELRGAFLEEIEADGVSEEAQRHIDWLIRLADKTSSMKK